MKKTLLFVWAIAYLSVTYAADLTQQYRMPNIRFLKQLLPIVVNLVLTYFQEVDHSLNKRLVALCRIFALIQTHYYQIKKGR